MMERAERRGRRRRGGGHAAKAVDDSIHQLPWNGNLVNPYRPMEIVDEEAIEKIHQTSLTILEEIGIEVLLPEAVERYKAAGADVKPGSDRVRFDRAMIEELVAKAPSQFTLHARNPDKNLTIGGNHMAFCPVASAPNCSDMEGGRRRGNQEDFRKFVKLGQFFNIMHLHGGYSVEPVDLPPATRHLDCLYDFATMGDKVYHAYSLGRERNLDALEITRIARGISEDQLSEEPSLITVINSSSPLRLDNPMMQGIIEMSSRNQVVILTPFTLSGAMAPVTIAGALAQQNAEALAGIAFTQIVRPGSPAVYGGFTSNVDMKTGSPAFGTPEYVRAAQIGGQLARRYNLPYRSSNTNASNAVDAQAAYESVMSLWGALMGGANILKHGAGWMEGGLTASFEKFIIDIDLLQQMAEYMKPIEVNDDTLALDAVRDVGPGGHFFGTAHTQERYKDAFYAPLVSDWRNFETWELDGGRDALWRANALYKKALDEYEMPHMDPAIREELDAFVARRKAEGGVPTDF